MAGGMLGGGGGDAWARDHEEILEHARGLGYDKVPGVSLPPADAPKETWISEMDKFNAWKASELAKPEASRWWVTRPWSSAEGTVSGGGGSSRIGPGNPYYPQRVPTFTPRTAQDWSAYMPAGSPLAVNRGILYQADINSQGIPDSIWNYQPPMLYASGGGVGGLSLGTGGRGGLLIGTGGGGSESPSASSGIGIFDSEGKYQPAKDVIPGTRGVTVQDLFDYESKGAETPIFNDQGVQDRRYFVRPDMRQDIVRQDIQRAKEEAYMKAAQPVNVPINVGRINPLTPEVVIDWTRIPSGSDWVQDQLNDEINRVTNLIDFRPSSREEAQRGGGEGLGNPYGGTAGPGGNI